jgi:hypothetical protein
MSSVLLVRASPWRRQMGPIGSLNTLAWGCAATDMWTVGWLCRWQVSLVSQLLLLRNKLSCHHTPITKHTRSPEPGSVFALSVLKAEPIVSQSTMVAEDRCRHLVYLFSYFVHNPYCIINMWHWFLYHESSYVWDLILAHIWYAPGFVLKSGCDSTLPFASFLYLLLSSSNLDPHGREYELVLISWRDNEDDVACHGLLRRCGNGLLLVMDSP